MNDIINLGNVKCNNIDNVGLHILFEDDNCISFTQSEIEKYFNEMWNDSSVFPQHIKEAAELKVCDHCPGKKSGKILCEALKPILPFIKDVDEYLSSEKVTVILKSSDPDLVTISHTDLQNALGYVSNLSLMCYCETNRNFWPYYFGVNPLSNMEQTLSQIYLNIFWLNNGDKDKTKRALDKYTEEIRISNECLLKRIKLISKNDAFMNAFANTQMSNEYLSVDVDFILERAFKMHNDKLVKTVNSE